MLGLTGRLRAQASMRLQVELADSKVGLMLAMSRNSATKAMLERDKMGIGLR